MYVYMYTCMYIKSQLQNILRNFFLLIILLGQVLHFVEKPSTFISDIINCGIYLFTPEIFTQIGMVFQRNQEDRLL